MAIACSAIGATGNYSEEEVAMTGCSIRVGSSWGKGREAEACCPQRRTYARAVKQ